MFMNEDHGYELEIHAPVVISGNSDSLEADVERCSKAVEEFIRQRPAQWIWMHKRYKSVCSEIYA
jgi:lauroyl/myristoyl acyltransferase